MRCIVFEDPLTSQLSPINLARPTFRITCGALCLADLLADLGWTVHYQPRPHLRGIIDRAGLAIPGDLEGPILYLNAALLPDPKILGRIRQLVEAGDPFLSLADQRVTVAYCPSGPIPDPKVRNPEDLPGFLLEQRLEPIEDEFPTLEYTFDVIRHHPRLLPEHLEYILDRGNYEKLSAEVYALEGAEIAPNVVFDSSGGPIVLGKGVRVRAFSYVAGPVRIGDNSLIIDHASIKHNTVLGHTVKAGGEIEDAVIEPYSNKQHHGFLGHAYVGSWVNLGAGTSNSDLKNTYGEISIDVGDRHVKTGLQFLGCVIGDFTKTAINTSIFTGKQIGVCSFVYGFVSTNVPSFTNYARSFGQVTEVGVDVAVKTQARAAKRRGLELTDAEAAMLRDIFELTRSERQLSSEQIVL